MKSRGKAAARGAVSGSKTTVYEGGTGFAIAYADQALKKNFEAIRTRGWASGAVMIVAGHFLKRKKSLGTVGAAACGAGGLLLGQYFQNRKTTAATTPAAAPVAAPAAPPAATETQGFDTGRVVRFPRSDAGFVVRSAARAV